MALKLQPPRYATLHDRTAPGRPWGVPAQAVSPAKAQRLACIILVLDARGLVPIFGIPAVRRLVLLTRRTGLERVSPRQGGVGSGRGLRPPSSGGLPPGGEFFHPGRSSAWARIGPRHEGPGDEGESRDRPVPFRLVAAPKRGGPARPGKRQGRATDSASRTAASSFPCSL